MKNSYTFIGFLLLQLATLYANAQTIDYSYKQLSTTSCNIFASATRIDNYEHLTALGRPTYDDNSILLKCKSNNTTSVLSTIYSIKFPFKAGHNYKISVYYLGQKNTSDSYFPSVGLKISKGNGGTDAGTNCINPPSYLLSDAYSFVYATASNSYAWANNVINASANQDYDYLLVGAFPQPGAIYSDYASIWIRKIQIEETALPPAPVDCSGITIQGPDQICDGSANYSLSSYVGTDNTWSFYSNDGGAFLSSASGISNALTKGDDGQAILKVVLSGCTDATSTKYKTVTMGPGALTGYCYPRNDVSQPLYRETYGYNILGEGGNNLVIVTGPAGAETWELLNSYTSSGNPVTFSYNQGGSLNINVPYGETYAEFKLTIQTPCGPKEYLFEFIAGYGNPFYSLSPNPSSSDVTIYVDEEKLKNTKAMSSSDQVIQKIIVLDKLGNAVLKRSYPFDTRKVILNISNLSPDLYVVKIYNGKKWTSLKLIKR